MTEPAVTDILGYTPKKKRRTSDHYRSGFSRLWLYHYLDESNRQTFFNAKASAIAAGHDGKNPQMAGCYHKRMWGPVIDEWMDEVGLSDTELKAKIVGLINAKETKFIKVKGAVNPDDLAEGTRVIASTGTIEKGAQGSEWYGDGDTLLAVETESLAIQTKNIETAVKIKGLIKPPVVEVNGLDTLVDDILKARNRTQEPKEVDFNDLLE